MALYDEDTLITNGLFQSAAILVLGGASYNTSVYLYKFPEPRPQTVFGHGYHETIGSSGAGKALNLNKLGLDVTFHGVIADDEWGRKIRDYLFQEGVNFIYDLDPQGTKRHINLMDSNGGRISIFIAHGSFEPQVDMQQIAAYIPQSDYIALNVINYCRYLIPVIKQAQATHPIPIWCDIHDYDGQNPYHQDFIDAADVLFMSSDAMPDYKPFMERLIEEGKELVVCTHGREGATALTARGEWVEVPIVDAYQRVDTNGAGDSFFSGVLYGHAQGYHIETCLRLGAIVSGLCITSKELAYPNLSAEIVAMEYEKHYGESLGQG